MPIRKLKPTQNTYVDKYSAPNSYPTMTKKNALNSSCTKPKDENAVTYELFQIP